jgi:hypothetical protein
MFVPGVGSAMLWAIAQTRRKGSKGESTGAVATRGTSAAMRR